MQRWGGSQSALLLTLAMSACGVDDGHDGARQLETCIFGGGARSEYLKLEPSQENAIAHVYLIADGEVESSHGYCSGVLVAERWVLTAAHCAPSAETTRAWVQFGGQRLPGGPPCGAAPDLIRGIVSERMVVHEALDLVLIELEESPKDHVAIVPLAFGRSIPEVGAWLELAGFGWTEAGTRGELRFATESLSEVTDVHIVVDGQGRSGGCASDSGGPLLMRDEQGVVVVVGILDMGSASCTGIDLYTRVDKAADWLAKYLPAVDGEKPVCTTLGREGRCFGSRAVWCEGDELVAATCAEQQSCGFDDKNAGYRCVDPDLSKCGAVTDLGTCDDQRAMWCHHGELTTATCAECYHSPMSARVICEQ